MTSDIISKTCCEIHKLFHSMERHTFPFGTDIPQNGIYILFEKGEMGHGSDRIVRIGTHTGVNQLRSRLKRHFVLENKDRSIFRKNIGRSILNKNKDPFLEQWEWDLTSRNSRLKHENILNKSKKCYTEKNVTDYIQKNLSFVAFKVDDKQERLLLESRIISTVSLCHECHHSEKWLGLSSPKRKIRESSLWLVNELYKAPMNGTELKRLIRLCSSTNNL